MKLRISLSLLGVLSPTAAAWAADEIHWTMTGPTSVTVSWRGPETTIRYGTTAAYGQTVTAGSPDPMPFSSPGPFREARLTGLDAHTHYHYSIGDGPDHRFHTTPAPGSSFTVHAQGDVGDSASWWRVGAVQSLIAAGAPSFVLVLGDLTYGDVNGQAAVDRHFNDVMAWSRDAAYMPAWGNHEWDTGDDLRNYKGRFDLPNARASTGAPSAGCCGEDWYWFDAGNTRFIGYPEPYTNATMDEWAAAADTLMTRAQADPSIRFIVTFGHRAAYASGFHGGNSELRPHLDALGASHSKYVLNLSAHNHDYERNHPRNGVVHVVVGIGGSPFERASGGCPWHGGCPPPSPSAFRAFRHGALRLRFSPTAIVGDAICGPPGDEGENRNDIPCESGTSFDSFVIGDPSTPAPGGSTSGILFESIRPNPAVDRATVTFVLAASGRTWIELLDLGGRALSRTDLGSIGSGRHVIDVPTSAPRLPGVFWLRVSQPAGSVSRKVVRLQ